MGEKKNRQLNMEILRIVAMLMIITLHYLDKGGILGDFNEAKGFAGNMAWALEAVSMVSVNLYVLISGYFLCESEFKVKKLILIWAQVLAYSWVITGVFAVVGHGLTLENGVYDLIPLVFPVTGGQYWFATVYILMYALSPLFNKAIAGMDRKLHKRMLIVSIAVFSLWNTFLPFTQPLADREGMDICWFAVLYLTAAYIRKYKDDIKVNKWLCLGIFFAASLSAFGLGKLLLLADRITGKLGGYAQNFYPYNSFFIFVAATALFIFAVKTEIKGNGILQKIIIFASSGTFGVYLLHEHSLMRYRWPLWANTSSFAGRPAFLLHMIVTVIAVFVAGICVDFLRRLIFKIFVKS